MTEADYFENGVPVPVIVELGAQLFFDKILSGSLNISCTTSHDSMAGPADALTLCIGEGGRALGVIRDTSLGDQVVHDRVLRNAVAGFNDGAREHQLPEVRWS